MCSMVGRPVRSRFSLRKLYKDSVKPSVLYVMRQRLMPMASGLALHQGLVVCFSLSILFSIRVSTKIVDILFFLWVFS